MELHGSVTVLPLGYRALFLIPALEKCAFCTSLLLLHLQAKGEQEQSGECLLISKILPSVVLYGIFHAKKNPSSQALQFEKPLKEQTLGLFL